VVVGDQQDVDVRHVVHGVAIGAIECPARERHGPGIGFQHRVDQDTLTCNLNKER
jgi:hypothetical protein